MERKLTSRRGLIAAFVITYLIGFTVIRVGFTRSSPYSLPNDRVFGISKGCHDDGCVGGISEYRMSWMVGAGLASVYRPLTMIEEAVIGANFMAPQRMVEVSQARVVE